MPKVIKEDIDGKGRRIGIVISRFNREVTDQLLSGALNALKENGVLDEDIVIAEVPGAFEIPLSVKVMVEGRQFHGVVALGAVIRGETPHFEYISRFVATAIGELSLETRIPVGFGVLTTETVQQAIDRARSDKYNRGAQAALTVLAMVNLLGELKS